jgi:hypothetical protein
MLTKPVSAGDDHGGGDMFDPGSQPESDFLEWFNAP